MENTQSPVSEDTLVANHLPNQTQPAEQIKLRHIDNFEASRALRAKSHNLIPGGAHTYAKGDDQYPEQAPAFIARGEGCHVWDVDGNEYIEYNMGLRSVSLGHGFKPVLDAAYQEMQRGLNFTRPSYLELQCAERFLSLINGAEMVKFAKNGSDVTTAAIKLARAYTHRELVAVCAEHPFFSVDDWFIGSTPMAAGIPGPIKSQTIKFHYNDLASLQALFEQHPNQIACVILEAETTEAPKDNFLHRVQQLCHEHGAVFILDEMITGFRWHAKGAQAVYQITPDLSTFGKAFGNGFAISALAGKAEIMELGGLTHDKERVFLLSTTHGAETHALAAAMQVITTYEQEPVIAHMQAQGERLRAGVQAAIEAANVTGYFEVMGNPANLIHATRDREKNRSQVFRTLFMQEMIKRGVIAPSLVLSYAHSQADIDYTIQAVAESLEVYRRALDEGPEKYLIGKPVKPVFRAVN